MPQRPNRPDVPEGWPPRRPPPSLKVNVPAGARRYIGLGIGLLVLAGLVGAMFGTNQGGIVEVKSTEVAVIINYWTGEKRLVTTPGYQIFLPVLEQAFKFDAQPQEFRMEGDEDLDPNHVPKLRVRANDGSNFSFETLEIQYEIKREEAQRLLGDSGPGDAFKRNWVRAYARSILRDEFGKYSAVEVADPSNYGEAIATAKNRLNEVLEPHAIAIKEIITPRPKFDAKYEQAINDRKTADQEVERLGAQEDQLDRERERRLAEVDRDKNTAYTELEGTLEAARIDAERDLVRLERDADAFKIARANEGKAARERLLQEAQGLTVQAHKDAEGLAARVEALAQRGEILVREALADRLKQIEFTVVPYRRDPAPIRIEHLGGSVPATGKEKQ